MTASPTLINVDRAAALLGMSPPSVRRQITTGTFAFPARKSGSTYLIPARPILEFLGLESLPAA